MQAFDALKTSALDQMSEAFEMDSTRLENALASISARAHEICSTAVDVAGDTRLSADAGKVLELSGKELLTEIRKKYTNWNEPDRLGLVKVTSNARRQTDTAWVKPSNVEAFKQHGAALLARNAADQPQREASTVVEQLQLELSRSEEQRHLSQAEVNRLQSELEAMRQHGRTTGSTPDGPASSIPGTVEPLPMEIQHAQLQLKASSEHASSIQSQAKAASQEPQPPVLKQAWNPPTDDVEESDVINKDHITQTSREKKVSNCTMQ